MEEILTLYSKNMRLENGDIDYFMINLSCDRQALPPASHPFLTVYFSPVDSRVYTGIEKDFDGVILPQGVSVDIGAFEFHCFKEYSYLDAEPTLYDDFRV